MVDKVKTQSQNPKSKPAPSGQASGSAVALNSKIISGMVDNQSPDLFLPSGTF
jgi:hypothetical protein